MGLNMVTRLARAGHNVVAYDRSPEAVTRAGTAGAEGAASLEELVSTLVAPEGHLADGAGRRRHRIDGERARPAALGRRHRHRRRQLQLSRRRAAGAGAGHAGIRYVDAGTSGGIWASRKAIASWSAATRGLPAPGAIFLTLAPKDGYLRVGEPGAGHYVKMIHNGSSTASCRRTPKGSS
jgi:6-phosphogluconate dehydrogenase